MTTAINAAAPRSVSTQELDKQPKVPVASLTLPVATQLPATKAVSAVVSIGAAKPDLGLYNKAGVTAATKPAAPEALAISNGGVVAGSGHVVVDVQASDSGYDNKIYYSTDNFKTKQYIGVDNHTGSVDLGQFAAGTKIQFGIDNGQGDFFRTGAASDNKDNFQHAKTSATSDGGVQIGFEDLRGGGDRDFNDVNIKIRNVPTAPVPVAAAAKPVVTPPVVAKPVITPPVVAKPVILPTPVPVPSVPVDPKTNHSGLGDGTNPGNGAGKTNSPNTGTNNPSANVVTTPAPAAKPITAAPVTPAPAAKPVTQAVPATAAKPAVPAPATPATPAKPVVVAAKPAVVAPPVVAKPAAPIVTANPVAAPGKASTTPAVTPATTPKAATVTPSPTTPDVKTNHSGIGDGTNPGQGAGTANSPNTGTLNPGGLKKV